MLSNGIYIVVQLHSGQELDKYVVKELYKSVLNEFMVKVGNGKHLRVYCLLLEKCSTHFTSRLHAALPAVILFSNRIFLITSKTRPEKKLIKDNIIKNPPKIADGSFSTNPVI